MQRKEELFPHAFWLVTSWTREQMSAEQLLTHYRQRGTAEGHFGELMDMLAPALSSARRPKSNDQGHPPVRRSVSIEAFANNEVRLLLNALAYHLVHAARVLLEQATYQERAPVVEPARLFPVQVRAAPVVSGSDTLEVLIASGRRVSFAMRTAAGPRSCPLDVPKTRAPPARGPARRGAPAPIPRRAAPVLDHQDCARQASS
ncbi:MAG TPA: hypothetical protein VFZ09_14585 [Archangium sp.]|nr:hypothetical protein [Archangium sp.]HEX5747469.1 hypothetical protein [Archangium sp.]